MSYFDACKTVEEVKTLYRKLAIQHHPDKGGAVETMQAINNAYHEALENLSGQKTTDKHGNDHVYKYWYEREQAIVDKIYEVLSELQETDTHVFLIGLWIWVFGDTKPHKDKLKQLGFKYAKHRQAWTWKPYHAKSRRSSGSLNWIAAKYGAEEITAKDKGKQERKEEKREPVRNVPSKRPYATRPAQPTLL